VRITGAKTSPMNVRAPSKVEVADDAGTKANIVVWVNSDFDDVSYFNPIVGQVYSLFNVAVKKSTFDGNG